MRKILALSLVYLILGLGTANASAVTFGLNSGHWANGTHLNNSSYTLTGLDKVVTPIQQYVISGDYSHATNYHSVFSSDNWKITVNKGFTVNSLSIDFDTAGMTITQFTLEKMVGTKATVLDTISNASSFNNPNVVGGSGYNTGLSFNNINLAAGVYSLLVSGSINSLPGNGGTKYDYALGTPSTEFETPLPASFWLFGTGIAGLMLYSYCRQNKTGVFRNANPVKLQILSATEI
jgi:hypothetical protein